MTIDTKSAWVERVQDRLDEPEMERSWNWLSRKIGISRAYMSKIKNGTRRMTPKVRRDIAQVLRRTEAELFEIRG